MAKFTGFADWVEIFRGGTQTDSNGKAHDGDALIDRAVATFDPAYHEPPAVLGHPKDDAPAYGWVKEVKQSLQDGGNVLLARFGDVAEGFEDAVRDGRFKKRSAAFYPNGRLRHVGFLGAMPPAVKGLMDVRFTEEEAVVFEFEELSPWSWRTIAGVFRKLREYLIEKEGKAAADEIIPHWDIEEIGDEAAKKEAPTEAINGFEEHTNTNKGESAMKFSEFMQAINIFKKLGGKDEEIDLIAPTVPASPADGDGKTFTEADIEAAKKEAAATAKKTAETTFAEAEKKKRREADKAAIAAFCEAGVKDGTLAPAWIDAGIRTFMEQLDGEAVIEFSEGGEKQAASAWFRTFLEGLPKLVNFDEIARRDKDVGGGDAAGKLEALVREKLKAGKDLTYSAAFSEVQAEHPALAEEYQREVTPDE